MIGEFCICRMILVIVTDRLLRGEGLTTDTLGRGTIAIVMVGGDLPATSALGFSA